MPIVVPRRYIYVDTIRSAAGIEFPQKVHWYDGRSWEIEKTQMIQPVSKLTDGSVCFTVIIGGAEKKIYKDYKGWYVHPKRKQMI
jgi:hypothetical protein